MLNRLPGLHPLACFALFIVLSAHTAAAQTPPPAAPSPPPASQGRLAYVQGGDVWYRELPDGDPHRLTVDGNTGGPRWSHSGEWLAYRTDQGGVSLKQLDWGQDRAFPLDGGNPIGSFDWSPIDDRIAYVASSGDLWVCDARRPDPSAADSLPVHKVRPSPIGRIAWSPDGQWLAYDVTQVLREKAGQPPDRYAGLWRVRPDGTEASEVFSQGSPAEDGILLAGWSPTGQSLLARPDPMFSASILADGVPLIEVPLAGGEVRRLSASLLLPPGFIAPAPTGDALALAAGEGRETWRNKFIQIIDLATGEARRVSDGTLAAVSPGWSPDGMRLAFSAAPALPDTVGGGEEARVGLSQRRIWLVNRDGTGQVPLTSDPSFRDEAPAWSPDGRLVLFARLDSEGRATLWLASPENGQPRLVVDELSPLSDWFGYYGHIDWPGLFDWWQPPSQPGTGPTPAG